MKKFPKKYNYKSIENKRLQTKKDLDNKGKIYRNDESLYSYSTLFPLDQKIHPWCIFSLFFQDLIAQFSRIKWENSSWKIWFWLSSYSYSKFNNEDLDAKQLYSNILKQWKQNIKFLDKLWLSYETTDRSSILSEDFTRYIRKVFVDLYSDNKILEQKEIAYRSKQLQTNLFKNSIKTIKKQVTEYSIKYFIDSKWHAIIIPTTSLETIFADVAIVVNPQDKRYKKLIGKEVIIPIINKVIPVIWDETVDSFKWSWVFRVTPGHDKFGLDMAQKHNLPTDVFAIDIYGNFTKNAWEFAWKPVEDFLDNIRKYIDDIWNLDDTRVVEVEQKLNLHTNEELENIMLNQRSIEYSYALDYLSQEIDWEKFKIIPEKEKDEILEVLESRKMVNISNKSKKWILIPIVLASKWDIYPINDDIILERYKQQNKKKTLTFTLILSNLILDNFLPVSFDVEKLVDVLFSNDISGTKTKIEKYLDIYKKESEKIKEYKKGLKDIQKLLWKIEKDNEKINILTDLLKDSFAIKIEDEIIRLDFPTLFGKRDDLVLQTQDWFNKSFIDSVWYLYNNNLSYDNSSYEDIKTLWQTLFLSEDQKDFWLNSLLLMLEYSRRFPFWSLYFHPTLVDIKWNKIVNSNSRFLVKDFGENIAAYGNDVMRLTTLLSEKSTVSKSIIDTTNTANNEWREKTFDVVKFDTYKVEEYSHFLNKIWNASRYVYMQHIPTLNSKKISIKWLIKNINSNITEYDLWMIHSVKSMIDDYEYQLQQDDKVLDLGTKIMKFAKEVMSSKYLEATKIYHSKNTSSVVVLSFVLILRLLKPYMPWFITEIEDVFDIDRWDYKVFDFRKYIPEEKNYKINLFMDIVDKLQSLKTDMWAKKHETIDIFVQANPEFLTFLSETYELLDSLVNISDVKYIKLHEDSPVWYTTTNVININLWVKAIEQVEVKKDVLTEMEWSRDEKIEHLQHLKSLVASVSKIWNEDIISQKRKEISKLQKEIEDLDFEITRFKAK